MTEDRARARIYLDTCTFIYAIEGETALAAPLQQLFLAGRMSPGALVTSELTLAEVLCKTDQSAPVRRLYMDLLIFSGVVELQPVTREVLMDSAQLRRTIAPFKLADAIHVASAIRTDCSFFMSTDARLKTLPDSMRKITADALGVETVSKALHV